MKKREFEPIIKILLRYYDEKHCDLLFVSEIQDGARDSPYIQKVLLFLQAKKYISVSINVAGGFDSLKILPACITYFYDKSQARKSAIANWSMNIFIALASAIFGAVLARLSFVLFP